MIFRFRSLCGPLLDDVLDQAHHSIRLAPIHAVLQVVESGHLRDQPVVLAKCRCHIPEASIDMGLHAEFNDGGVERRPHNVRQTRTMSTWREQS